MPEGRRHSPSRHDENKLFVGGISHKFRDGDLKQAFGPYGSMRATVMIDRKTGRSRGFGFVYLADHEALHDAIKEMHGAILDGRKISVTRAVPETQTMPGTPATLLAAGKGIRSARGVRGGGWEGSDGIRGSPRTGPRGGRGKRFDRGGRYGKPSGGFSGRSRGRSPFDRYHAPSRDRSRSLSMDRGSRGSSADSQGSIPRTTDAKYPPYEDALELLQAMKYDSSGFKDYFAGCKPLEMAGWEPFDDDSPAPRRKDSRRGSVDRGDRGTSWPQQGSAFHEGPSGVGGMRGGTVRSRSDREPRGRPERYSRDLR